MSPEKMKPWEYAIGIGCAIGWCVIGVYVLGSLLGVWN